MQQAWQTYIWGVSPILLCRSSQALSGWMGSFAAQLFSGLSRDVSSGSSPGLAGPLKDIQRLVPKPLLCCIGCVLRVVVLLEGKPSPHSEVLSTVEQVFIKDLSILCSIHNCLDLDYSPSTCHWKSSPQHGARFPPDVTLGIQDKKVQSWFRQNREYCFSLSESLLVPFGKLQAGCHVPFTEEWLPSGHSTMKCCRVVCPSGRFSHLHRGTLELC